MRRTMPDRDWLDRRASNAKLIAEARARVAAGSRAILRGEQLVQQSAKLMLQSPLDPPARPPQSLKLLDEARAEQARYEQHRIRTLREVGYSLLSHVEEMVVTSQESRWQARQTRMRAQAERKRSLRLRRTLDPPPPALRKAHRRCRRRTAVTPSQFRSHNDTSAKSMMTV